MSLHILLYFISMWKKEILQDNTFFIMIITMIDWLEKEELYLRGTIDVEI